MNDVSDVIAAACTQAFDCDVRVIVTRPDEQFGDFATNVALQIAQQMGKNPRDVAATLAAQIRQAASDDVAEVTVAGPGFINIRLTDRALLQSVVAPRSMPLTGQTVLVEYSDPNAFKPLHAGHLYTTLVGDVIARLCEAAGAHVVRLNYGGDVGRHIGICMWGIIQHLGGELPQELSNITPVDRPTWLGARYVEGNAAFEDDPTATAAILEMNKKVYQIHADQDHDSAFAQIYWTCRQWSYDYFAVLYEQLQVHAFDRFIPESEVTELGVQTVMTQLQNGVYESSDGAVVFRGEPYGLHTRVFINSQGLPTYEAKDVGLIQMKWTDYHFDQSIVITANEQMEYHKVMLKSVEQFAPDLVSRSHHLHHGVVKLQGGVKMSSRKGNVVSALDIIEAAHTAGHESGRATDETTILAAIKYAFAKNRIGGDIVYDPRESVALEGNSGPYLQYAHARAHGIVSKSTFSSNTVAPIDLQPGERTLVRKLTEYQEVVQRATAEYMPHHVCSYLYELAQTFNRFYEQNRVIGDPREQQRLHLVRIYAQTLKDGLGLLGIDAPESM